MNNKTESGVGKGKNENEGSYLKWVKTGCDSPVLYSDGFGRMRVLAFSIGSFAGPSLELATSFKH